MSCSRQSTARRRCLGKSGGTWALYSTSLPVVRNARSRHNRLWRFPFKPPALLGGIGSKSQEENNEKGDELIAGPVLSVESVKGRWLLRMARRLSTHVSAHHYSSMESLARSFCGATLRQVHRDLRFAAFGHVEPVERVVDKLGRAVRIVHFARERQALHGMNAILCDNAHASSLEPMHRPTVPRRRIALRQKGMRPQVAVGGWPGMAVACQPAFAPVARAPRISTADAPEITLVEEFIVSSLVSHVKCVRGPA